MSFANIGASNQIAMMTPVGQQTVQSQKTQGSELLENAANKTDSASTHIKPTVNGWHETKPSEIQGNTIAIAIHRAGHSSKNGVGDVRTSKMLNSALRESGKSERPALKGRVGPIKPPRPQTKSRSGPIEQQHRTHGGANLVPMERTNSDRRMEYDQQINAALNLSYNVPEARANTTKTTRIKIAEIIPKTLGKASKIAINDTNKVLLFKAKIQTSTSLFIEMQIFKFTRLVQGNVADSWSKDETQLTKEAIQKLSCFIEECDKNIKKLSEYLCRPDIGEEKKDIVNKKINEINTAKANAEKSKDSKNSYIDAIASRRTTFHSQLPSSKIGCGRLRGSLIDYKTAYPEGGFLTKKINDLS